MDVIKPLIQVFEKHLSEHPLTREPFNLYQPADYILSLGGKRLRPVFVLMGYDFYKKDIERSLNAAMAVEIFHNFTLLHDDIMDKAPLRRGMQTVHTKYGENTALLAGDVMLVKAYEYLSRIDGDFLKPIMHLFNQTAREVCEGQQWDMDYEKQESVHLDEYLRMIELKTSVLLAASLKMGAILGGSGERNQNLLYEFGRKLGIAFQVQDDYLDAFGDPEKFGKQVGGDILANKKTFLLIHALETANAEQLEELKQLIAGNPADKVEQVLRIFRDCKVDEWAIELKNKYLDEAFQHLDDIAVLSKRKQPLTDLARFLVQREH